LFVDGHVISNAACPSPRQALRGFDLDADLWAGRPKVAGVDARLQTSVEGVSGGGPIPACDVPRGNLFPKAVVLRGGPVVEN